MNMQHPNSMPKPFQASYFHRRPARLCAAAALLFLQGCAASYVPVAYSRPVQVSTYVPPVYVAPAPVAAPAPVELAPMFSAAQIDQLVGPIALYPDPLLAQLLPAATYPLDIVRAAQLVRGTPTEEQINAQNWDASVKAIAHYPSVLEYMDTNLEWTQQLGQAFVTQPEDVMQSVQRLRTQATAMGNLISTPQQQVVVDDQGEVGIQYIRIIPAVAEIVYVPVYQPQVVYCQPASFITFGIGFHMGSWLNMDCDWRHRCVYRPTWTWNHWHNHHHIVHNRIAYRDRHDNDRHDSRDHHDRPSNQWHRDSSRPLHLPGRESQWADRNDRDRDSRGGSPSPRANRVVGSVTPDAGRGNSGSGESSWPSQRNTNLDSFRGAPSADQAPTRPNVPSIRPSGPVSRPDVPSARPNTPSRPTISPPSRPDTSAQAPTRPPTPQARPNISTAPNRPAVQGPAPSRPSTPAASRPAPSRPSIQTTPAPSRPSAPPAASPAPSRPSTPPPAARPAPQTPPRAATPAPSRPSTPAPSRPQAQPSPPSRPPTPAPSAAPRPSQPAASPSAPPSRPNVPKNPR